MVIELVDQLISQEGQVEAVEDSKAIANMDKHKTIPDMHNMDRYESTNLYNNCNNDNREHQHSKTKNIKLDCTHRLISTYLITQSM